MHFKPMKDFLLYIENCHKALADLYHRLSVEASDDKVILLLEYMKTKEQLSYINLHEYIQRAPLSLLETWLADFFDQSFPQRCKYLKLKPDLTIEDVVTLAIQLDMQLIKAMQTAAYNSTTTEAEQMLENLSHQEEEMLHQVVIASREFEYV